MKDDPRSISHKDLCLIVTALSERVTGLNNRVLYLEKKNDIEKYPMKQGERAMWAILGTGGAIYGFQPNQQKAEEVRDKCWNIGKRKPKKYIVNFRETF